MTMDKIYPSYLSTCRFASNHPIEFNYMSLYHSIIILPFMIEAIEAIGAIKVLEGLFVYTLLMSKIDLMSQGDSRIMKPSFSEFSPNY